VADAIEGKAAKVRVDLLGALRYLFLYSSVSAGAPGGILVLIVIKHLGVPGSLYGVIRRRPRP
jgi:hypothetical protein